METIKTFRHELKYVIPYETMLQLREKFNKLLTIDRDYNGYMVRSLYFDSIEDKDYYDKLGGELNRKKIRLRIYYPNTDYVKLEIKAKYDYHQIKESLLITKEVAEEIIKGNYGILLNYDNEVAKKIYVILTKGYYKPKVIIEYNRIAYKTATTTRITFDYNIRRTNNIEDFFKENINYYKLTDDSTVILEVKFDRFLEPYINEILNNHISRTQSISKYLMGRS